MSLEFTKMHALGNDFMVIDGVSKSLDIRIADIIAWGERHTGIGFDQCLLVEKSTDPRIDFFYRIFNADGSEVGQCGNGARCLALFLVQKGLTKKKCISVSTKTTTMRLQINDNNTVTIEMAPPSFAPADIPLLSFDQQSEYELSLEDNKSISIHALSIGNPHAVTIVSDLTHINIDSVGLAISKHSAFPEQANVGFMKIVNPDQIDLRVYERGCGETKACGSGAVAAAVVGRLFYNMHETIQVNLPGGRLIVDWQGEGCPVYLTGGGTFVYEGKVLS
jgi:diaminopimelate epimerase